MLGRTACRAVWARGYIASRRFEEWLCEGHLWEGVTPVQINISTRHGSVSEQTRSKILAKLEKLERYFGRLTQVEVTIDLERRDEPAVDIKVHAEHRHDFVGSYRSGDLLGAVDQAVHKVEEQLRRYKQKIQEHHRAGGSRHGGSLEGGISGPA